MIAPAWGAADGRRHGLATATRTDTAEPFRAGQRSKRTKYAMAVPPSRHGAGRWNASWYGRDRESDLQVGNVGENASLTRARFSTGAIKLARASITARDRREWIVRRSQARPHCQRPCADHSNWGARARRSRASEGRRHGADDGLESGTHSPNVPLLSRFSSNAERRRAALGIGSAHDAGWTAVSSTTHSSTGGRSARTVIRPRAGYSTRRS